MQFENVIIKSIGRYIPEKVVKNEFFVEHFSKPEWGSLRVDGLLRKLGRDERHFCELGESSLTMAIESSKDALNKSNIDAKDIDMIVFASDTPEYLTPTNAILVSKALKANNANVVFDLNSNCAGMVVALDLVTTYMKMHKNIKRAILVGSLHSSSIVRYSDSVTYTNFGDASTALVLEKVQSNSGVVDSRFKADNSYSGLAKYPACGNSEALLKTQDKHYRRLEWNPFDSSFFSDMFIEAISSLMKENNLTDSDIAYYAFSQLSNAQNIETLTRLGASIDERYLYNGDKFGYTGTNSPFLALSDVWDDIDKYKGKYVIIITIGAGVNMCAILYKV